MTPLLVISVTVRSLLDHRTHDPAVAVTRESCKPGSIQVTNPRNPRVSSARMGAWRKTGQEKAVWSGHSQSICGYLNKKCHSETVVTKEYAVTRQVEAAEPGN